MSAVPEPPESVAGAADVRRLDVLNLGRRAYGPVHALQEALVARRKAGTIADTLVFVEHEPVYTLGRSAKDAHVLLREDELAARGIDLVRIGRGGDVTYHGPGQLVGYPIIKLAALGVGAVGYVTGLEQCLIRVLADFGIAAGTDPINRGVWVGANKIAAIGVRITGGVTMHGFALNVRTDMAPYAGIVPCGIASRGVTSMHLLQPGAAVTLDAVVARFLIAFSERFGYDSIHPDAGVGASVVAEARELYEHT